MLNFIQLVLKKEISPASAALGSLIVFILLVALFSFIAQQYGVRSQLLEKKYLWISFAFGFVAGSIFLLIRYLQTREEFVTIAIPALSIALAIAIMITAVAKMGFYRTIPYKQLQRVEYLEPNQEILRVSDLKVHYPIYGGFFKKQIASVRAVDGISFELKSGETFGLVGESGCGKSTTASSILGFVTKNHGTIQFNGKELENPFPLSIRKDIQIVFQDPDASLNPRIKVIDIIADPLKNLMGITDGDRLRARVLELLELVSLKKEHLDRYPHEFSGGQKQRIVIARALACNPKLIILDEPTSALDVSVQAQILNLLKDLQKRYHYAFIFITHNLAVVNHIADNIAVMYLGKFVEVGKVNSIFTDPKHPYTKALLSARSDADPEHKRTRIILDGEVPSPVNPPKGCHFYPRCQSTNKSEKCREQYPELIKISEGHSVACKEFE